MLCAVLKKTGSPRFAPLVKKFGSTSVHSEGATRRILSEDRGEDLGQLSERMWKF